MPDVEAALIEVHLRQSPAAAKSGEGSLDHQATWRYLETLTWPDPLHLYSLGSGF
jgi:hypothetical protein